MKPDELLPLIVLGLERGISDLQLAKKLNLPSAFVRKYRLFLGISSEQVTQFRYDTWLRLIREGKSTEEVSLLYGVQPATVRKLLTTERGFKMRQHKREVALAKTKKMKASFFDW